MIDDPVAQRLREAVWADPEPDAPRMVYADYLLEQGDPLGELIALQLARARTGAAVSARELEVVREHGSRVLQPLEAELQMRDHWTQEWELSRGFLAVAEALQAMPEEAAHHPMWATVEKLVVRDVDHPVLFNPHLRPSTLQAYEDVVLALARRTTPLPFRALTGTGPHGGVSQFEHDGAFARVRTLRVRGTAPRAWSLFARLAHLDVTFSESRVDVLREWCQEWEPMKISRFSAHVPLYVTAEPGELDESVAAGGEPSHHLYVEINRASDYVVLQLDQATGNYHVPTALAVIAAVAGRRTRVIVEDLSNHRGWRDQHIEVLHDAERTKQNHPELLEALRSLFIEVTVTDRAMRRRAP